MVSLREQIIAQKQTKKEKLKDIFYVDECNNCKDIEIRGTYGKHYTPCNHQWYCHKDQGPVQELETKIARIKHDTWMRGYMCSSEYETLKELNKEKQGLIRECRRNMPRIKH